jgi:Domain of unknown function (DUF4423)
MTELAPLNYGDLAAQFIRALRGKRSQVGFSRRLGYRTNILYVWEAKRGAPTAAGFMHVASRAGVDLQRAFATFYRDTPAWLTAHDPLEPSAMAAFLDDLRGRTTLIDIAGSLRCSRFALSRWLKGKAEPRLPDFLQLIEVTSLRLLDFVAAFTDPGEIPCLAERWQQLQRAREAAYERPWSHAVLRALELEQYAGLSRHHAGWLAAQLGISLEEEKACVELLSSSGQIVKRRGKWVIQRALTTDTRRDPQAARQLKAWWSRVGTERFNAGASGVFSYNVFGVSRADLEQLEALQRAYFRQLRSIVAQSHPVQEVAVVNLQLFSLLSGPERETRSPEAAPP